ncbi:cobalamin biosynthesis protein CobD [Deferribacter autotrophicus]|uniref:Cobalamin biosynthesis protein CobD n=1 Tax=Deferribacter autotrophicus TaxID=500465 RepID=A0A5A8F3E4_9BACT|nr:adenosylcobinamide-phosphate synthase CbiB [Deferribacter autotrophicus]KAA0257847.1 cobalamin biosynthesis protein CobD [Deferribacter autotrophicus]
MIDPLILAVLLDIIFGELPNRFHPVALNGRMISYYEKIFYKVENRVFGGTFLFIASQLTVLSVIYLLSKMFKGNQFLLFSFKTFVFYSFLSIKGMKDHAMEIFYLLFHDVEEAKKRLKYIVSRDVDGMDEEKIVKSVVESVGENFNDAFFAPIIYAAVFGVYGIAFYRVANTLDAMVGYRNEKYEKFGKFSAKMDDILNYVSARLQVVPLILSAGLLFKRSKEAFNAFLKFRNALSSPNAGCGISIFAGALNITLGGDTYYFGKLIKKPDIVGGDEKVTPFKILDAVELYFSAAILTLIFYAVLKLLCV